MVVTIVASNIRVGGGLTHLVELVRPWRPGSYGIDELVVVAPKVVQERLPGSSARFVVVPSEPGLVNVLRRWRVLFDKFSCDVLFAPGGTYLGRNRHFVTLSQNILPFDDTERSRYSGFRLLRLLILRWSQTYSMRRATGTLFLSEYARRTVSKASGLLGNAKTIPHGIDARFRRKPDPPRVFTDDSPMRLLYVSILSPYKHQRHVVEAVSLLRKKGTPVTLTLCGRSEPAELAKLEETLDRLDARGFVRYLGDISHEAIHTVYHAADAFVFASSCENLPNILIEAMASGLPIASSSKGPMPDVLGNAGLYFDPEDPRDIARSVEELAREPKLRSQLAEAAFERSAEYQWERTARETFEFLVSAAKS